MTDEESLRRSRAAYAVLGKLLEEYCRTLPALLREYLELTAGLYLAELLSAGAFTPAPQE